MISDVQAQKITEEKLALLKYMNTDLSYDPNESDIKKKIGTVNWYVIAIAERKTPFLKVCNDLGVQVGEDDPINKTDIDVSTEMVLAYLTPDSTVKETELVYSYIGALIRSIQTKLLRIGTMLIAQAPEPENRYKLIGFEPGTGNALFGEVNYLLSELGGFGIDIGFAETSIMYEAVLWLRKNKTSEINPRSPGKPEVSFWDISPGDTRSAIYYKMRTADDELVKSGTPLPRSALSREDYVKQIWKVPPPDGWTQEEVVSAFPLHVDHSTIIKSFAPSKRVETRGFDLNKWPKK